MSKNKRVKWTPFQRAYRDPSVVEDILAQHGEAIARAYMEETIYMNSLYQVNVNVNSDREPQVAWLSVKRLDKKAIRDWRDLQRIKNEICGPECEAVELFPAESRLHDTANQFHLFVVLDESYRFPFGFQYRMVSEHSEGGGYGKMRQRAFDADVRPLDLMTPEQVAKMDTLIKVIRPRMDLIHQTFSEDADA